MRNAQIEMMGLVVVVILVTLGLFFSVSLQPPRQEKAPLAVYSDEQLASNFLITLLDTHLPESDTRVRDLAIDCVREHNELPVRRSYGSTNACNKLTEVTEEILRKTLGEWGYEYELTYTYKDAEGDSEELLALGDGCGENQERSAPGRQPISLFRVTTGSALMRLDICG